MSSGLHVSLNSLFQRLTPRYRAAVTHHDPLCLVSALSGSLSQLNLG